MVEKITKYLSLASVLILIGGVWYHYLFYSAFGIDFFSYVTFTEILTLFLEAMPMLILTGLVVGIFLFVMSQVFEKRIREITLIKSFTEHEQRQIRAKYLKYTLLILMLCLLLFMGPAMLPITQLTKRFKSSEWYFMMRVCATFIFLSTALIPYVGSKLEARKIPLYGSIFVVIFYCAVYYSSSHKLWAVKKDPNRYINQVTLLLKDSTRIQSNDSLIMIGKTNNYLFLYKIEPKAELSHTDILPMDLIKRIYVFKYVGWFRFP